MHGGASGASGAGAEGLRFRPARHSDGAAIARVHAETWQFAYKGLLPDALLESISVEHRTRIWEQNLSASGGAGQTFVALSDDELVGFCSVGPCRDTDLEGRIGELFAIYVAPRAMNQGAGSTLMEMGLESLRGQNYERAILWVLSANKKTRAWYEKRSWMPDGATKTEELGGFEVHETRYVINF